MIDKWNSLIRILTNKGILTNDDLVQIWKDTTPQEKQDAYYAE